jgi:predicted Rossmann fold nucleotide-binding protein DprA/Smf involved in DNA uptake
MNSSLSPNTQAILLLTAPLIVGRTERSSDVLTPGEYKRLARFLRDQQLQPADLLGEAASDVLDECGELLDRSRLQRLLDRGFLLSQAVEFWQARAIWVVSRADPDYPQRLKDLLMDDAPAVLYGCGDASILGTGGLAVVGSRHVDDELLDYAGAVGRLAARSDRTLISGGARGIDQAAMFGALAAGGQAIGILADRLERSAMLRDVRDYVLEQQLVLISPFDPLAGFNVGNAMQRNKLIYALADAALVVSSDYKKGGTWTGAIEQLERYRFVPVFVRSEGIEQEGLKALQRKGALPWPKPKTPDELYTALACEPHPIHQAENDAASVSAMQQSLFADS